jgi:hypothetical protein
VRSSSQAIDEEMVCCLFYLSFLLFELYFIYLASLWYCNTGRSWHLFCFSYVGYYVCSDFVALIAFSWNLCYEMLNLSYVELLEYFWIMKLKMHDHLLIQILFSSACWSDIVDKYYWMDVWHLKWLITIYLIVKIHDGV